MSTAPTAPPPEPVPHRPWRAADGPAPVVWTWPRDDRPALRVWSAGDWRYAPVLARQDWSDGAVCYQVQVDLLGDTTVTLQLYEWPQPGLRVARRSDATPLSGAAAAAAQQESMPRAPGAAGAGAAQGIQSESF